MKINKKPNSKGAFIVYKSNHTLSHLPPYATIYANQVLFPQAWTEKTTILRVA